MAWLQLLQDAFYYLDGEIVRSEEVVAHDSQPEASRYDTDVVRKRTKAYRDMKRDRVGYGLVVKRVGVVVVGGEAINCHSTHYHQIWQSCRIVLDPSSTPTHRHHPLVVSTWSERIHSCLRCGLVFRLKESGRRYYEGTAGWDLGNLSL